VSTLSILLLRHGVTDSNIGGVLQGHMPTSLNAAGHLQAARLAARLAGFTPRIEVLIASDLARARETAAPVARSLGLDVTVDSTWRERSFGPFEGKSVGETDIWRAATGALELPGAEPADAFHDRVASALNGLVERHASCACVAVVTHGGPIRAVINLLRAGRLLLAADQAAPDLVPIENCSIMRLHVSVGAHQAREWRVVSVNDVVHLHSRTPAAIAR
jgi:broad specificity phosphatase PhoE